MFVSLSDDSGSWQWEYKFQVVSEKALCRTFFYGVIMLNSSE